MQILPWPPNALLFPLKFGLACTFVYLIAESLFTLARLSQSKGVIHDRGSFWLLLLFFYGAVLFSLLDVFVLQWSLFSPRFALFQYVGIPFVMLGLAARLVARLTLRNAFSRRVQTSGSHRLVKQGVYKVIRHPAYLGLLLLMLGLPLCLASFVGVSIAIFSGISSLVYRIYIEEMALSTWFGDEYRDYAQKTHRLIPFLW